MNFVDIIILLCVILILSLILYFNIKNHKSNDGHCSKCPYNNNCCKKTKNKNTCQENSSNKKAT